MTVCDPAGWPCPLLYLGTAVVFLLLGWKFGRESAGRPLFDFPPGRPVRGEDAATGEDVDPWAEAAAGRAGPDGEVDRNETLPWP